MLEGQANRATDEVLQVSGMKQRHLEALEGWHQLYVINRNNFGSPGCEKLHGLMTKAQKFDIPLKAKGYAVLIELKVNNSLIHGDEREVCR